MILSKSVLNALYDLCPGGVTPDVDLSIMSQWRIGGKADVVIQPSTTGELVALRRWFSDRDINPVVIGLTSNLLFSDEGLRVPCIQITRRLSDVLTQGTKVTAEAGVWVPSLARQLMKSGLTGAEHTCGIPGTLGGLVCMNGGSQRKGIGTNVMRVESVNGKGEVIQRNGEECNFGYRKSIYQSKNEVITRVTLRFHRRNVGVIRREMNGILSGRRRKFPRNKPNCGSVFKSNPAMYAEIGPPGVAIERLGLKGKRIGNALVAPEHANFILNSGGATASDVLALTRAISDAVTENTGFRMEAEARFVTASGEIVALDKVANNRV